MVISVATRKTRPVEWLKPARKDFAMFPQKANRRCSFALTMASEGAKSDLAKPLHGMGSGVFEIALESAGNAFRLIYTVEFAQAIWVVHAFKKKSPHGIKTPQHDIDLIKDRLTKLREELQ